MNVKDIQQYTEVKIPNTDLVIKLRHRLPWYDQIELIKIDNDIESARFLIWKLIADWNLVDDDGNKIPITKELVDEFSSDVIIPLQKAINEIIDEQKQKKKN